MSQPSVEFNALGRRIPPKSVLTEIGRIVGFLIALPYLFLEGLVRGLFRLVFNKVTLCALGVAIVGWCVYSGIDLLANGSVRDLLAAIVILLFVGLLIRN